jgi:hypothetical protein
MPGLNVFEYALDVALPLINLGQDTYCRFAPVGPVALGVVAAA